MSHIYDELCRDIIRQEIEAAVTKSEDSITDKVNSLATEILEEILVVLHNCELSDFDIVERIVCIMEKYDIDCGICHDFG